jgi:hypothetical protein
LGINRNRAEEIQRYNSQQDSQVTAVYAQFKKNLPPKKSLKKGKTSLCRIDINIFYLPHLLITACPSEGQWKR